MPYGACGLQQLAGQSRRGSSAGLSIQAHVLHPIGVRSELHSSTFLKYSMLFHTPLTSTLFPLLHIFLHIHPLPHPPGRHPGHGAAGRPTAPWLGHTARPGQCGG